MARAPLEAQRRAYASQGHVCLGPVLTDEQLGVVRASVDEAAQSRATTAASAYGDIVHNPWTRSQACAELIAAALFEPARTLLDCDQLVLFQDLFISKPPGTSTPISWHQDYSYWPLDGPTGVTLWIALDDTDVDNGCLHYMPGTHHLGERQPADFVAGASPPRRPDLPALDVTAHAGQAIAAAIPAGTALAHHPLLWHMSPANRSRAPRRAWSITWLSPAARWAPEHAPHPFCYSQQPVAGAAVTGALFPRFP